MNMVRCMISENGISKSFWPEAVNWTTLAVRNQTREEAWSRDKASVEHFRVFGCGTCAYPKCKKNKVR